MNILKINTTCFAILFLSISSVFSQDENPAGKLNKEYHYFDNPQVCSGCHWDRFDRWNVSQHSKGFTGDFFQKQFYDLVLLPEHVQKYVLNLTPSADRFLFHLPQQRILYTQRNF